MSSIYMQFEEFVRDNGKLIHTEKSPRGEKPVYAYNSYMVMLDPKSNDEKRIVMVIGTYKRKPTFVSKAFMRGEHQLGAKLFGVKLDESVSNPERLRELLDSWDTERKYH